MKQQNRHREPRCSHDPPAGRPAVSPAALDRAARLFRAMGDPQRLALLQHLAVGERCVSELVQITGDKFPTVSQRLKILHTEGLVRRRRDGLHVHYALADGHVADLIANALLHADELIAPSPRAARPAAHPPEDPTMSCSKHAQHDHAHGAGCGHTAVKHGDHVDHLHDGHLHHTAADGSVHEHALAVDATNPAACTPSHACAGHAKGHVHGPNCGHEAVPHGDHTDYLVDGHLHHPHGDHCDDHGPVAVVK